MSKLQLLSHTDNHKLSGHLLTFHRLHRHLESILQRTRKLCRQHLFLSLYLPMLPSSQSQFPTICLRLPTVCPQYSTTCPQFSTICLPLAHHLSALPRGQVDYPRLVASLKSSRAAVSHVVLLPSRSLALLSQISPALLHCLGRRLIPSVRCLPPLDLPSPIPYCVDWTLYLMAQPLRLSTLYLTSSGKASSSNFLLARVQKHLTQAARVSGAFLQL
jgi:hypothetical protein